MFSDFMHDMPPWSYYNNQKPEHSETLDKLRNWMKDMEDCRVERYRGLDYAIDSFYVPWEEEDGVFTGAMFKILTHRENNGSKSIELRAYYAKREYIDIYVKFKTNPNKKLVS